MRSSPAGTDAGGTRHGRRLGARSEQQPTRPPAQLSVGLEKSAALTQTQKHRTEHELTLPRPSGHAATDPDTLELVRRLAVDYPDHQIAGILARQGRRTGVGNPFTADRVRSLRAHHKIPSRTPRTPPPAGTDRVTVGQAARQLGVSTATVHRWLREGFIIGEQATANAPWQIQITPELRARICQHAPEGWLPLAEAAAALGLARQTVLHKVQRDELPAVYVQHGKRKGLRIQVIPRQVGLFDNDRREEKQC